jgi:pilus assembly protein CpaB
MNRRFVSVLLFAFVVAAGTSAVLYRLLSHKAASRQELPVVQVVLAARNLDTGTLIKDQDVKTGPWAGALPPGALAKKDDVVGRGVLSAMVNNEPVLESRLAQRGAGAGLASMIPSGMRAVAVRVNEVVGVAGFVVAGMRVDILISGTPPNADARLGNLTKTLLQNIEVLSAGQDFRKDAEGKPVAVPVVNLLVTPEQAEKLSLAANQTTIQLVLRNPLDTRTADTPGAAVAQLFGPRFVRIDEPRAERPRPASVRRPRAPAVQPPPPLRPVSTIVSANPSPFVIETIHGGRRAETRFPEKAQ